MWLVVQQVRGLSGLYTRVASGQLIWKHVICSLHLPQFPYGKLATLNDQSTNRLLSVPINPFTPKSGQFQVSPAASPEISRHTVWRIWLFIAYYSNERLLYFQFSLHTYTFLFNGWENVLFVLAKANFNYKLRQELNEAWKCLTMELMEEPTLYLPEENRY